MPGLLNISEAMSIALHTCAWLAGAPEGFHAGRRISDDLGISHHHFAKVARQLARAGIIETERGPIGGARLARCASELSLLQIYKAAGGQPELDGCLLKSSICDGVRCALGELMARENQRLIEMLSSLTLADVVRSLSSDPSRHETCKPADADAPRVSRRQPGEPA